MSVNDQIAVGAFCPVCEAEIVRGVKAKEWAEADRLVREHVLLVHARRLGVPLEFMREGRHEVEVGEYGVPGLPGNRVQCSGVADRYDRVGRPIRQTEE